MCCPESVTQEGFETHFGTNHLGHFLLLQLLLPALLASSTPSFNSRLVSLTSSNHIFSRVHLDDPKLRASIPYNANLAYAQVTTFLLALGLGTEKNHWVALHFLHPVHCHLHGLHGHSF